MDAYLVLLVMACVMNAVLLLVSMLQGDDTNGVYLLLAGFGVLAINVLSFGLVYWWMDDGGPAQRAAAVSGTQDFLFPQQATADRVAPRPHRLPVHRVHEHHRLQPDGHHAAHPPVEGAVHDPVLDGRADDRGDA